MHALRKIPGTEFLTDGFEINTDSEVWLPLFEAACVRLLAFEVQREKKRHRPTRDDFGVDAHDGDGSIPLKVRRKGLPYDNFTSYVEHSFGRFGGHHACGWVVFVQDLCFKYVGFVAYPTLETLKMTWELD